MSLKAFHIFFIVLAVALAVGFGVWGIQDYATSQSRVNLGLAASSFLGAGALTAYLLWFLRKIKKSGLLFFFLSLLFSDRTLWACSVCFGDPHSDTSKGLKLAVLFLIGVVGVVLTAIASIAFRWAHRAHKTSPSPH